mmetsp:Transcript_21705/g.41121  ORF Transcript_21705/g.41121 Transcript_21705/m.41121 type:complete len:292 (-) Transcript_21705:184-1059(-)|eukprot:scaffold1033_cov171-Amphora_coffeaeformis.AAC.2
MNADSDQAFLSLLSSQRELLNRLNMEATATSKCNQDSVTTKDLNCSNHRPACTNHSISERRSSLDFVMSKRLSIGFGCDPFSFSFTDAKSELVPSSWKDEDMDLFSVDKRSKEDAFGFEVTKRRKKRRMSSLGFLSPMFFEENLEKPSRRDSITFGPDENDPLVSDDLAVEEPAETKSQSSEESKDTEESEEKDQQEEDEDDDASTGSVSVEPIDYAQPRLDPVKFRETMEAFHNSMEMSQNSQQAIHDWDRKMGLKRSHSKTMRLSTRSRKKLRAIMKKEISNLVMAIKC